MRLNSIWLMFYSFVMIFQYKSLIYSQHVSSPALLWPCQTLTSLPPGRRNVCPVVVAVVYLAPSSVGRPAGPGVLSLPEPRPSIFAAVAGRHPLPVAAASHTWNIISIIVQKLCNQVLPILIP